MAVKNDNWPTMASTAGEVVVTRVVAAPRSLVYAAWTDPRHVVHWWQPTGFAPPVVETMDVRPGGVFRVRMRHADGVDYTWYGVYRTVVEGERLVYEDFCEEAGALFSLHDDDSDPRGAGREDDDHDPRVSGPGARP